MVAVSLFIFTSASAENNWISDSDINNVYKALGSGDWLGAENNAKSLISKKSPAQNNLIARMRYIYLFSIYKQLEAKQLSYTGFVNKINLTLNKEVLQPWHPIKSGSNNCFNYICNSEAEKDILWTAQTNDSGTQIYSFEYFNAGYPFDISSFDGQNARLGGTLEKIEVNQNLQPAIASNSNVTWYLRLHFKDAYIQYER